MSEKKVTHAKAQKEAIEQLRILGGKGIKDEDIIHNGSKFILPEGMTTEQALKNLNLMVEGLEQETSFKKTFKYRPWDGANATYKVLHETFGSLGSKSQESFFGSRPPSLIQIEIGPNETAEVPWGTLTIGAIPDVYLNLFAVNDPELGELFALEIEGKKRHRHEAEGIFKLIENYLATNSIYRGKAIDGGSMPGFLDLDGVDPNRVTYSDEVIHQLHANIWSLIERTKEVRQLKLPLKRAVLIEGPFGTGKTLAAFLTAQKCVLNGWTFLYARPGKDDLSEVMKTARLYQPAVVFMEDMDVQSGASEENDEESTDVSELLDLFDGINAKSTEILAILTTNYVERITRGMLRPGRLDAIIHINALDHSGIRRLIEANVDNSRRESDIDWDSVYEAMEGYMPAFVKEAGDRAIRYALARGVPASNIKINTEDLVRAAQGLRPQFNLMNKRREEKKDSLNEAMKKTIAESLRGNGLSTMEEQISEIHNQVV